MEMELEQLSFWLPEGANSPSDYLTIVAHPSPIFSPLPREYGSFLEAIEAEFSFEEDSGSPPAPPPPQVTEVSVEDYVGGGDEGGSRKRRAKAGAVEATAEAPEEEEESGMGNVGCKNLMSERNRRRRLNQQLLSLRSLVPCISKMDKRSILMDAATYLQNLHKEIEQIKREIAEQEAAQELATSSESNITSSPEISAQEEASSNHHHIFKIETDEIDERTLTVKVVFRKAGGAPAQVQRMIESLGASMTHTWTHEMEDNQMVTTSFINVKKQMSVTAEMLKEHMSKAAIKMGFEIDLDD